MNSTDIIRPIKLSGGTLVHVSFTRSSIDPYGCWNVASSSRWHSLSTICIIKLHNYIRHRFHLERLRHSQPIGVKVCLNTDFEKLQRSRGGLLSFNSFLSTSSNRQVSLVFAESSAQRIDAIGVLFVLIIDPKSTTVPFAKVKHSSYFSYEDEVLFSMHAVFRIVEIDVLPKLHESVIEVRLTLTGDDDPKLRILTNHIQETISRGQSANKLGNLLMDLRESTEADKVYNIGDLNKGTNDELAYRYHHLALIRSHQGEYQQAIDYNKRALSIRQQRLPLNDPRLAPSYNNIAGVYADMGGVCEST